MKIFISLIAACLMMVSFNVVQAADAPTEKLTVISAKDGSKHDFDVEIADTPTDREIGLMYRTMMDPDHGMLFEMEQNAVVQFWMKNTLIPLDMVFVASDGTIKAIHADAIPQDLTGISSEAPVTGVIELNGGRAKALGLAVGDKVVHPYFHDVK
jgi:uncharacterized membrane protein (UPF0127 family)